MDLRVKPKCNISAPNECTRQLHFDAPPEYPYVVTELRKMKKAEAF
jgi:hypothetical protein